jgi:hypothetical protein
VRDDAPAFEHFDLATFPGPVYVMDLVSRVGADVGEYHRENGDVSVAVVDAAVERAVSELSGDGGLQALTVYKREGA